MFARLVMTLCLLSVASPALADASVVVLGLRSIEGDDDVANELTDRLRSAAGAVQGWSVSSAAVSMAQMSLAHGCEDIDAACLKDIAEGLKADVVVYGTIRRNSAHADYDYSLSISMFDARTGEIAKTLDDIVPREEQTARLDTRAQKIMGRLASTSVGGTIAVQASAEDAQVRINGQDVGRTRDGALRLGGLRPGQYRIEIMKDGFAPHVSTVTVSEGSESSIAAVLSPIGPAGAPIEAYEDAGEPGGGHQLAWLGWTLVGVSAASLVGMGVSMAIITEIDQDPLKQQYSDAVKAGNDRAEAMNLPDEVFDDICVAARRGFGYDLGVEAAREVADKCNTADTMEVLQWVFLGTAVAAAGTGLYLVLSADDVPRDYGKARGPSLALRPRVSTKGAGLTASLRF